MSDTPKAPKRTTRETTNRYRKDGRCACCGTEPGWRHKMSCVYGRGGTLTVGATSPAGAYVGLRALAEQASPGRDLTMGDMARELARAEPQGPGGRRALCRVDLTDGRTVVAVLEVQPEGGYTACIPELPGCVTEGDTVEEALASSREAAELWLASQ